MKKCTKCGEIKPLEDFDKDKRIKSGHIAKCKECRRAYSSQYRQNNLDKLREREEKYRQRNAEKFKEYKRSWKENNAEKMRQLQKEYRLKNKEQLKVYYKKWSKTNRDKLLKNVRRFLQTEKGRDYMYRRNIKRRSYKHNVSFTPHQRKTLLERDNYTCQCCGIKVHDEKINNPTKAHIDHIIPISKGGNSEPDNLQVLCRTCNLSKSDKLIV